MCSRAHEIADEIPDDANSSRIRITMLISIGSRIVLLKIYIKTQMETYQGLKPYYNAHGPRTPQSS